MYRFKSFRKVNREAKVSIAEQVDRAYMAGLFDGEGTFSIGVRRKKRPPEFYPIVRIFMSHEPVIEEIGELLGYTYATVERKRKGKKLRTMYGITITIEEDVRLFLTQLYPYLRVKKQHADLILSFISVREFQTERTLRVALEELGFWYEVRKLNPKGPPVTKEDYEEMRKETVRSFS